MIASSKLGFAPALDWVIELTIDAQVVLGSDSLWGIMRVMVPDSVPELF
jgi:hypothetical protein